MLLGKMRLQDIGPFRGLGAAARELGIPLTLIGGAASRAAIRLVQRPRVALDLFDLAPFSSDLDLEYDAGPEAGPELMAAIQEHVPFASWFRWSLIDRDRAAAAAAQREVSTIVPLRSIRYSTHGPPHISEEALMDLHTGHVRVRRNPAFHPGVGSRRDAEIFGLMMALNAEADFRAVDKNAPGLDEDAALSWLASDGWADLVRIVEDEQLRGRFWTLFATRWSLAGPRGVVFERLTDMAEEIGIFRRLGFDATDVEAPIGLSKVSARGQFRAPDLRPRVITGEDAAHAFVSVMNDVIGGLGLRRRIRTPAEALDPSLELVAVAPNVIITKLENTSEPQPDVFESGIDEEFIEISWKHRGRTPKGGLTAQLLPYKQSRRAASFSSVPAIGGIQGERAWIRIRLDDLMDPDAVETTVSAALVILQARYA